MPVSRRAMLAGSTAAAAAPLLGIAVPESRRSAGGASSRQAAHLPAQPRSWAGGAVRHQPADPNIGIQWDFAEFTYNTAQLFANVSMVDFVSIPIGLTLTDTSGKFPHDKHRSEKGGWACPACCDPSHVAVSALPEAG